MITGHFEAKKYSYRQNDKGFFVTLFIHPQDLSPDFVLAPTGTRFQIGYAEMDDNEIPNEVEVGNKGGDGDASIEVTSNIEDAVPADWHSPFDGG